MCVGVSSSFKEYKSFVAVKVLSRHNVCSKVYQNGYQLTTTRHKHNRMPQKAAKLCSELLKCSMLAAMTRCSRQLSCQLRQLLAANS
jgi:hypothetical protein